MIIQIYSEAKYLKQSNMHGIYKTDKFGFLSQSLSSTNDLNASFCLFFAALFKNDVFNQCICSGPTLIRLTRYTIFTLHYRVF